MPARVMTSRQSAPTGSLDLIDDWTTCLLIEVQHCDGHAVLGESVGHGGPDPPSSTGDNCYATHAGLLCD